MARLLLISLAVAVLTALSGFAVMAVGAVAPAKVLLSVFLVIFLGVLVVSSVSHSGRETVP